MILCICIDIHIFIFTLQVTYIEAFYRNVTLTSPVVPRRDPSHPAHQGEKLGRQVKRDKRGNRCLNKRGQLSHGEICEKVLKRSVSNGFKMNFIYNLKYKNIMLQ